MDLLILTSALDKSLAAATSAAVVTPLEGPDGLPQLVVGTTEPITVKFLSAASAYETWADDPTYTMSVALGQLSKDGINAYASATLATIITDGKSGNLALTTAALVNALTRPRTTVMTLQVTVTDPSGNKRVYAQLPVAVVGTLASFTQT